MKIKLIHIYSHDSQRRDLQFKVDGLNVITGRSSTGKSALSEIIESHEKDEKGDKNEKGANGS